jgi:hypothetical protein
MLGFRSMHVTKQNTINRTQEFQQQLSNSNPVEVKAGTASESAACPSGHP